MPTTDSDLEIAPLIGELVTRSPTDTVGFTDVQKVLYLIQKHLPHHHPLANQLDFYWYLHGPMDNQVSVATRVATDNGYIEPVATSSPATPTGQKFVPGPASPATLTSETLTEQEYEEVQEALDTAIAEYSFDTRLDESLGPIYQDAPIDFYRYYRFNVLSELSNLGGLVPPKRESLKRAIQTGEAYLPCNEAYNRETKRYAEFASVARRYLHREDALTVDTRPPGTYLRQSPSDLESASTLEEYPQPARVTTAFGLLTSQIWTLFAMRTRIVTAGERHHTRISGWKEDLADHHDLFETHLHSLTEYLSSPDADTVTAADIEMTRQPENSPWGHYISSQFANSTNE